jgi:hypothetical protein
MSFLPQPDIRSARSRFRSAADIRLPTDQLGEERLHSLVLIVKS